MVGARVLVYQLKLRKYIRGWQITNLNENPSYALLFIFSTQAHSSDWSLENLDALNNGC